MTRSEIDTLISEMERFAHERGLSPAYVGSVAVRDGKFYARIKGGGRCWPETIERVRRTMAEWPAPAQEPAP